MNNPLHAEYYADDSLYETVEVIENVAIAESTYRLRFASPEIATRISPGQFLMVRLAGLNDPLIGRPLAMYDCTTDSAGVTAIDVVYVVKGKFTTRLSSFQPRQQLNVWGPLGNGFPTTPVDRLIIAAGGVGETPFLAVAKEALGRQAFSDPARPTGWAKEVTLCYGARTADYLAGVDDFRNAGMDVQLATDDGSMGHHGLVTDLVRKALDNRDADQSVRILCCGPEPMMAAVAEIAKEYDVECQVSLETPMACGIGICFSCVAKIKTKDGDWDYKRTCVEGPVFQADDIIW